MVIFVCSISYFSSFFCFASDDTMTSQEAKNVLSFLRKKKKLAMTIPDEIASSVEVGKSIEKNRVCMEEITGS